MFALHTVILTEVIWLAMGSLAAFSITCYHDLLLVVHLLIFNNFFHNRFMHVKQAVKVHWITSHLACS